MSTERRTALFAALGAATLVLTGCENERKPSSTATLLNNQEVHEAVKAIIGAVDELESNVDNFDAENWRDVVPEVKAAASNVAGAVGTLRQALGYSDAG